MPLPLTVSCSNKIQIGFAFLVPAHPGSPGKRAVKRVCVKTKDVSVSHFKNLNLALHKYFTVEYLLTSFERIGKYCCGCLNLIKIQVVWCLYSILEMAVANF